MNQRVLLVGVNVNNQYNFLELFLELKSLAAACELDIFSEVVQNIEEINPKYYLGSGKVKEIASIVEINNLDAVIFDNELSATQLRNLAKLIDVEILDRTTLILEIFRKRAKSKEAKLQVEIAKLRYMMPRLIGINTNYDRQQGGTGMLNRGAGEKQLTLDKRKIESRITELNRELKKVVKQRITQRRKRNKSQIPLVALVGYTNAGKSSIMNYFIDKFQDNHEKEVFEKNMVFATLDTSVRKIQLPNNKSFLLTDTVGFINQLPHELIKAFRSTLEEVCEADLLLQVVDYSSEFHQNHIKVTVDTLSYLNVGNTDMITVYNKCDLVENQPANRNDICYVSTKSGINMDILLAEIEKKIFKDYIDTEMLIPYECGNLVSYFEERSFVKELEQTETGTLIKIQCRISDYNKYRDFVVE